MASLDSSNRARYFASPCRKVASACWRSAAALSSTARRWRSAVSSRLCCPVVLTVSGIVLLRRFGILLIPLQLAGRWRVPAMPAPLLHTAKIVALRHLLHLARLPGLINLDAQGLDLLLQALFTGTHLADHVLEDPCQPRQFAVAVDDILQAGGVEDAILDGCRGLDEPSDIPQVALHMLQGTADGDF